MQEFKCRASQAGKLLTTPRTKGQLLAETTKTYLKEYLIQALYGRRKQIKNKYVDKGNYNEEDGVTLLSIVRKKWYDTNTDYAENDFFCGTCDINHEEDGIIDIKNSYSIDTFPMFESEIPNKDYVAQVNIYMELYNKRKGAVAYVLTDMPIELLKREIKWLESDDEKQQTSLNFIYSLEAWEKAKSELFPNAEPIEFIPIPNEKRVKIFNVEYDEDLIEKLKNKVEISRDYLAQLKNNS